MSFLSESFYFGINYNFATQSPYVSSYENLIDFPPITVNFLITQDDKKYITENSNFLITES